MGRCERYINHVTRLGRLDRPLLRVMVTVPCTLCGICGQCRSTAILFLCPKRSDSIHHSSALSVVTADGHSRSHTLLVSLPNRTEQPIPSAAMLARRAPFHGLSRNGMSVVKNRPENVKCRKAD